MNRMRVMIVAAIGILGFSLGVIFGLPVREGNFATVKIGGVSLAAEVVSDRASMARGLSGRENLAKNGAMLFLFDRPDHYGFWMKGMLFPIDIFWIKDNRIVDTEERAPPPAPGTDEKSLPVYIPDVPADMVLETRAGFAAEHHVRIGDAVEITGFQSSVGKRADGMQDTASLPPGEQYTIEYMRAHPPSGSDFKIVGALSNPTGDGYEKFSIAYRSGDLVISGVMNVPSGAVPKGGFPLLILNHGLIQPDVYFSGRGSKREQDFFARNGYVTIHPDYRGMASSSPNPAPHHDFYEGYAQDVLALIDALKQANTSLIDTDRIGMWGHSMGGGIAARAM
ncbi:MAG: alpha/beta fold hydrolase, partial [Candidatus Sungbacteria bacterium]|nr:alpha/beta fold hydrolase [Candidatus Sungbacteria bacterium]